MELPVRLGGEGEAAPSTLHICTRTQSSLDCAVPLVPLISTIAPSLHDMRSTSDSVGAAFSHKIHIAVNYLSMTAVCDFNRQMHSSLLFTTDQSHC